MESQASAIPSKASYGGLITCYMQPQWALDEYTCITESALLTMHSSLSLFWSWAQTARTSQPRISYLFTVRLLLSGQHFSLCRYLLT